MVKSLRETNYLYGAAVSGWLDLVNPNSSGADGRGAIRGIRILNMWNSGAAVSGATYLAITIDNTLLACGIVALPVPYGAGIVGFTSTGRGIYLNLGQFALGADYHEHPWISGGGVDATDWCCSMTVNEQRVPFHTRFRLQGRLNYNVSQASGIRVDTWYELKG